MSISWGPHRRRPGPHRNQEFVSRNQAVDTRAAHGHPSMRKHTIRLRTRLIRCGRYLRRGRKILAYPVLWTDFSRLNKRAERGLDQAPAVTLGTELCDDLGCRHALGVLG